MHALTFSSLSALSIGILTSLTARTSAAPNTYIPGFPRVVQADRSPSKLQEHQIIDPNSSTGTSTKRTALALPSGWKLGAACVSDTPDPDRLLSWSDNLTDMTINTCLNE